MHLLPSRSLQSPETTETPTRDLPLTLGLLLAIGGINLYVYTAAESAPTVGIIVPYLYFLLVLVGAYFLRRVGYWVVWGATVAANILMAAANPTETYLMFAAVVYAPASGITAGRIRRFRVEQENYAATLLALDSANADVQKKLAELTALFEISQKAALTFDLELLFRESMACIALRLRMYRGTLALFDPNSQEMGVKYAYGLTPEQVASSRYRFGDGIYGRVLVSGMPMGVPNIGDQPLFLSETNPRALDLETRSVAFLCVPIKMEGKTVGVLSVDRAPVDQRTLGDDLNFLLILASIFAQALKIQQMIESAVEHERLTVLGKIATSVAHEIRNPLGGIRGAAQLLNMTLMPSSGEGGVPPSQEAMEEVGAYTEIVIQEVDRLNRVVEQLLHFGHSRPNNKQKHSVTDLLEHVLFLTEQDTHSQHIEVSTEFAPDLPLVEVDGDQLTQVFLNLIRNAIEAMPEGGNLHLVASTSERVIHGVPNIGGVRRVEVNICDTGIGIPSHLREDIFNPLYTTKRKGTGIGLALSRRLVEEHGGYIEVRDNPPQGSCFSVILPAVQE